MRFPSIIILALLPAAQAFLAPTFTNLYQSSSTKLFKKKSSGPKGFGKETEKSITEPVAKATKSTNQPQQSTMLQSVEQGGSTERPKLENLSPEERAQQILKEKYGMKTLEEKQAETRQLQAIEEQRKKVNEWKKRAEEENFDLMTAIPAPILIAIDRFLKIGLGVTSLLFILGGIGITVEAYSKTTGKPLPENIDNFLVNVVEPSFTPGLFVLLGFSVSLGLFAAAQLGSQGATYREDK